MYVTDVVTEEYQAVVGIHALVCTMDLLVHCSLQAAVIHLGALHDKNNTLLAGQWPKLALQCNSSHMFFFSYV